jgi:hypothetical protein
MQKRIILSSIRVAKDVKRSDEVGETPTYNQEHIQHVHYLL